MKMRTEFETERQRELQKKRELEEAIKKKEAGGGKYPSSGPGAEYILKKDCLKNLNEMKSKLIEEYEKRIEMEKKKGKEELRLNQESIEKKNRKEIERLTEIHKQQDTERLREIERIREIQRKKELELEKLREQENSLRTQLENERQKELQKQRELEEKNRKKNYIKMNKEIEINYKRKEEDKGIITLRQVKEEEETRNIEEDIKRAKEILRLFILSRGAPITIKRKYFNVWRRKARLLQLLENSKIIQEFCRANLEMTKIKKVIRDWRNLSKKLYYKTRIKLLKMRKKCTKKTLRLKKLYELIRITRLTTLFSRRRFIHFIILIWNIYAKNIHRKRVNMKFLYENLLKTYMSLANDIFGNNQYENPSVQDAMYEAVNTNKFITMIPDDVPLARKHYEEMKRIKSVDNKDKSIYYKTNKYTKSYMTTTKVEEVGKKETNNKNYMGKISEKMEENNSDSEENKKEVERKRRLDFLSKYRKNKSYNKDTDKNKNYSYTAGYNDKDTSYNNVGDNKKDKDSIGKNSFIYKFGKKPDTKDDKSKENTNKYNTFNNISKYSMTEGNVDNKKGEIGKKNTYQYNRNKSDDKDASSYTSDNISKKQYSNKSLDNKKDKDKEGGKYVTKYGNNVSGVIFSSNLDPNQPNVAGKTTTTKTDKYIPSTDKNDKYKKYFPSSQTQSQYQSQSQTQYQKKSETTSKPYETYQKKMFIKTETEEPKYFSKKIEVKPATTSPNISTNNNFVYISNKDKDTDSKYKYGSVDKKYDTNKNKELHKSNTESKINFVYKSKNFGAADKKSNAEDDKKTETKYEKKYELKPYNSTSNTQSKNVVTKQYKSSRYNQ